MARAEPIRSEADLAYLNGLNPEQRAGVLAPPGPLLLLAGAGTGKTRVLTTRLAHLLLTGQARPSQVLAVTFTNKAAREMVHRVSHLIGRSCEGLWLGTFHALGARLLRRHAEMVGLKSNFTILDTDDQLRLLKQTLQAADLDEKRWPPRALSGIIQRWKDRGLTPDRVPTSEVGDFAMGRTVELYRTYQDRLLALNACDFGDLLLHVLTFLSKDESLLAQYRRQFATILVDEYQDTNVVQYLWLRLLAQDHGNITCVGDDDQSIYSWRGAEVGNILRFERDFPGARVIRLEQNYRSTGHILAGASGVIANNRDRLGKTLWTGDSLGEKINVVSLWDDEEEARFVGETIEMHKQNGGAFADTAVLVRAGFQTRAFEERFIATGLPYRVIGGPRFYERAEIRDAIAYLRLVAQPSDDLAFERIVNVPKRGIGDATVQRISRMARDQSITMLAATRAACATDELRPKVRGALQRLVDSLDRWRAMMADQLPRFLAETVLDESGYTQMWQDDGGPDAPGRLENLKELVRSVGEFDSLEGFLEHVSLVLDNASDPEGDMATIMTLHGAKGLEFDTVFLAGWEEGLFPHQRALDQEGAKGLEEERRLAYVGMTRARRRLYVCFASNRRVYNQWQVSLPSRFVEELPPEHIQMLNRVQRPRFEPSGLFDDIEAMGAGPRFRDRRGPPVIEGRSRLIEEPRASPRVPYTVGERVFHEKFGYGEVKLVDGNKLDIAFEKAGDKKVMDSFVKRPA
ncbi:ATP-dependent helicase [Marinivivus vitaminiproducens]|uniref:ATP-dependent helicase n=1 Tax=Marinivivus vitaminiproducens TaxID=3035935 RepID=UPI002797D5BC|nr:UvrD-helicase domain-containing protein [Geminicoccaceae bacterium SCSIO 64248]